MAELFKYPRTSHIQGSRRQPGDEDLDSVAFSEIAGMFVVVEEKCDGANAGISFDKNGQLLLQSRGHFLLGGAREKHFNLLKQWAAGIQSPLGRVLGTRYVLYGEWVYAKHTVFYDLLPHYFLEFDVLDLSTHRFLSTAERRNLLAGLPLVSVPVLFEGVLQTQKQLRSLIGQSNYIGSGHLEHLKHICAELGLEVERALKETDRTNLMEGLYLKVENKSHVVSRYKFIRPSFLTAVLNAEGHWLNRPIIANQLRPDVDLFAL